MLREGLEAALIVAIVLAYLKRLDRDPAFRAVWLGTIAAIVVSFVAGAFVFVALGELHGTAEQATEGTIALVSAGVLTWMIFWMGRQARSIKGQLHAKVDAALANGSGIALAGIAFVAVVREGLESSLYLLSTSVGERSSAANFVGALVGIAAAAALGYLLYKGSNRINLRSFFRITGLLIILFAAGLVAKGIVEFQEAGALATLNVHVWDVTRIGFLNPDSSGSGEALKSLFGWSAHPSVEMGVGYLLYLVPVGSRFLLQTRKVPATVTKAAPSEAIAA
jgi:high-affinity iron transporter